MLSADAAVIASGKCGSNLTWNVDDEANLTISGTGAMYDYYVKTIERPAFSSCDDLSFVYIGKSVASIGDAVFSGSNMWGYVYIRSTDCTISTHEDTFSGVNMIYGISDSTAEDRAEALGIEFRIMDLTVPEGYMYVTGLCGDNLRWKADSEGLLEISGTSEVYDYLNDMNQVFVDAVRSTGGNNDERILIASGYWTNIDNTTKSSFVMPSNPAADRMMVSVHYIDNACYWTNAVENDYWKNYSKSQYELLKKSFISKNIPIFVGECTASYTSDHIASNATIKDSYQCLSTILNMAVDYDMIPVLWDVSNGFYSKTNCKINKSSNSAVISEIAAKIANK